MPLQSKTLAILGAGNMGQALLGGLIDSRSLDPGQVSIHNRRPDRTAQIAEQFGARAASSNIDCAQKADVVLLGVKPQILLKVLDEVRGHLNDPLVLSIAAGVSTAQIESALGHQARVVRAMPNTPALIKQGATAISAGAFATEQDLEIAEAILGPTGRVVRVDEGLLDAVTGLSGSGPAYVFLIIEAFADAGVKVGLSREIALDLAVQTIQGAARMLQETKMHPGQLKDMVTSPGGTAIAGLHTLEEGGMRTTIMNAVEAATERAKELGRRS
ncbi:MAG: pyrroline-5-carboxylate reductase [Myxococcota bacterium]